MPGRTSEDTGKSSSCRFCGKRLGLIQRFSGSEFCSAAHREEFHKEQQELALACLQGAFSQTTLVPALGDPAYSGHLWQGPSKGTFSGKGILDAQDIDPTDRRFPAVTLIDSGPAAWEPREIPGYLDQFARPGGDRACSQAEVTGALELTYVQPVLVPASFTLRRDEDFEKCLEEARAQLSQPRAPAGIALARGFLRARLAMRVPDAVPLLELLTCPFVDAEEALQAQ